MDFVLELILEIYLSLFEIVIPEHKFKKWQETLLKLACVLVSIVILVGVIGGVFLLLDGEYKVLGIVFLSVGSVLLIIQIVLFGITIKYQIKKEKAAKEQKNKDLSE